MPLCLPPPIVSCESKLNTSTSVLPCTLSDGTKVMAHLEASAQGWRTIVVVLPDGLTVGYSEGMHAQDLSPLFQEALHVAGACALQS